MDEEVEVDENNFPSEHAHRTLLRTVKLSMAEQQEKRAERRESLQSRRESLTDRMQALQARSNTRRQSRLSVSDSGELQ